MYRNQRLRSDLKNSVIPSKLSRQLKSKDIYSDTDLGERLKFFDYPVCSAQDIVGHNTYKIKNDKFNHLEYPNSEYVFLKKISDGSASKLYIGSRDQPQKSEDFDLCQKSKDFELCPEDFDLKVIVKKISKKEDWRAELNILKSFANETPRLLNLIDFFESYRFAYIVTDFHKNLDLFEHISVNLPYSENIAFSLFKSMLLCLKECHDRSIAHLDIKFENFMVRKMFPETELVLIDFGHAEKMTPTSRDLLKNPEVCSENLIRSGISSYGTCYYLCPEAYNEVYSMKSDIWSMGICLHLLLTDEYPFMGSEDEEYSKNVFRGHIYISKKISPGPKSIIEMCLDYNPNNRPTVSELLEYFKN